MVKNITPQELETVAKENENAVLIDVRSPEECAEGMVDGALNMNLFDANFLEKIGKLDKSKTTI